MISIFLDSMHERQMTMYNEFFDGRGILRKPGEEFCDGRGILRKPGEEFCDGRGILRNR